MATIEYGHPAYNNHYPVLWSDWTDPLYMRESPAFGAPALKEIKRYELVHYISGYQDNGGYRWFFCRAWKSGRWQNSLWEVGWIPAVRLSDGKQVLKALGHYYIDSNGNKIREYHVRAVADGVCWDGSDAKSPGLYFPYAGDGDYYAGEVADTAPNRKIVPYPGQENLPKPWVVCGATYWWAAGGARIQSAYPEAYPCHVTFWETGMTGTDAVPPFFKRFN